MYWCYPIKTILFSSQPLHSEVNHAQRRMEEVKQAGQTLGQLQREVEQPITVTVQRSKEYSLPPSITHEKKPRTMEQVQMSFVQPVGKDMCQIGLELCVAACLDVY